MLIKFAAPRPSDNCLASPVVRAYLRFFQHADNAPIMVVSQPVWLSDLESEAGYRR
jgi:hypothetical protein